MTSLETVFVTPPTALLTVLAAEPTKLETAEAAPVSAEPRQTMKQPPTPNSGSPFAAHPRNAACPGTKIAPDAPTPEPVGNPAASAFAYHWWSTGSKTPPKSLV